MANFDNRFEQIITDNVNMTVPFYLMASYAYYEKDDPILSDDFYDKLAKNILKQWDNIEHYHKHLLSKDALEAGSYIGKYPTIVSEALKSLRKTAKK